MRLRGSGPLNSNLITYLMSNSPANYFFNIFLRKNWRGAGMLLLFEVDAIDGC